MGTSILNYLLWCSWSPCQGTALLDWLINRLFVHMPQNIERRAGGQPLFGKPLKNHPKFVGLGFPMVFWFIGFYSLLVYGFPIFSGLLVYWFLWFIWFIVFFLVSLVCTTQIRFMGFCSLHVNEFNGFSGFLVYYNINII